MNTFLPYWSKILGPTSLDKRCRPSSWRCTQIRSRLFTIIFLSFGTDRSGQTVQTQIRGAGSTLFAIPSPSFGCITLKGTPSCSTFRRLQQMFWVSEYLGNFTVPCRLHLTIVKPHCSVFRMITVKKNLGSHFLKYFYGTVMILSFRTPKNCVVITLKFELCGFTIE